MFCKPWHGVVAIGHSYQPWTCTSTNITIISLAPIKSFSRSPQGNVSIGGRRWMWECSEIINHSDKLLLKYKRLLYMQYYATVVHVQGCSHRGEVSGEHTICSWHAMVDDGICIVIAMCTQGVDWMLACWIIGHSFAGLWNSFGVCLKRAWMNSVL